MAWTIEYSETAKKQLRKFDRPVAHCILDYMDERIAVGDPRTFGKSLTGALGSLWCYQVGDYRIICDIQDKDLRVLVIQLGNRRGIYR